MNKLILMAKIAALKAARAAVIATLTEDEHKIYNAILRDKLINGHGTIKGIKYG